MLCSLRIDPNPNWLEIISSIDSEPCMQYLIVLLMLWRSVLASAYPRTQIHRFLDAVPFGSHLLKSHAKIGCFTMLVRFSSNCSTSKSLHAINDSVRFASYPCANKGEDSLLSVIRTLNVIAYFFLGVELS
jgi:hypothetical protein